MRIFMKLLLCISMLVTLFSLPAAAQVEDSRLPGGKTPGITASIFAPALVSGSDQEYGLAVTSDWSEIYFTRMSGEQSAIMRIARDGDTWSPAVPTSFSGVHNDGHPWLTPDGNRLYFMSRRSCPGAAQAANVWFVEQTADGWSDASSPGKPATDQTVHAPSVSASGSIYFTGLKRLRHVDGEYLPAERLTPDTNGSHPAVSPDEDFVVFSVRHEGGVGGKDLHVIFQKPDGSWTGPLNLGDTVNAEGNESSPTLSNDGRFLFFSRRGDIWWVDTAVIEAVRPEPAQD